MGRPSRLASRESMSEVGYGARPSGRLREPLGADQPLEAPALLNRGDGRAALDDAEASVEDALDLIARDGEGRAVLALAKREEAGEQRAAGSKDRVNRAHVLVAPGGIDRAEAGVLPRAVEEAGVRRGEREDVALLVRDRDTLLPREGHRLVDGRVREVEAPDAMAEPSQQPS